MTKAHFHTGRLFYQASEDEGLAGWYFETREGTPQGPFPSREEARAALDAHLTERSDGGDGRFNA